MLKTLADPAAAVLPQADVDAWLDDQRRRLEDDRFFAAMTHFVAFARAPA